MRGDEPHPSSNHGLGTRTTLKGRPGTSPNLQLLAIENSGEVGAGEAEAMGLAQARAKAAKAYGLSDGLELNK